LTRFSFDGYRWLRDGIEIDGQTNLTYTPTAADAGHGIQCEMIATDPPPYSVTATAMSASISVWPTPLLRVSRLRVSPRRLLAVGRLRVRYDLTQAATVRFTIERVEDGRRAGRRCNTHTAARERGPGCVRLHEIGRSTRRGLAGANQFVMPRRIGGRELAPGRYVLIATPTARGKTGIALRVTFQVVL